MADAGAGEAQNMWNQVDAEHALLDVRMGDGSQATWDEVLKELGTEAGRASFNAFLADCPFRAFFWEAPPLCQSTRGLTFQMCAVRAPDELLSSWEDPARLMRSTFDAVRQGRGSAAPAVFWASAPGTPPPPNPCTLLVAPGDLGGRARGRGNAVLACRHLASFVREARPEQQQALWCEVGKQLQARASEPRPTWVSTDGTGVYWLHVRLSWQPRYFKYEPYARSPSAPMAGGSAGGLGGGAWRAESDGMGAAASAAAAACEGGAVPSVAARVCTDSRIHWDSSHETVERFVAEVPPSRVGAAEGAEWIQVRNAVPDSRGYHDAPRQGDFDGDAYADHADSAAILAAAAAQECTSGKWMVFPEGAARTDGLWADVAVATAHGELGCSAKVVAAKGSDMSKGVLICVYVHDFRDRAEAGRVVRGLAAICRAHNVPLRAGFKPDVYTHLGVRLPPLYSPSEFL